MNSRKYTDVSVNGALELTAFGPELAPKGPWVLTNGPNYPTQSQGIRIRAIARKFSDGGLCQWGPRTEKIPKFCVGPKIAPQGSFRDENQWKRRRKSRGFRKSNQPQRLSDKLFRQQLAPKSYLGVKKWNRRRKTRRISKSRQNFKMLRLLLLYFQNTVIIIISVVIFIFSIIILL